MWIPIALSLTLIARFAHGQSLGSLGNSLAAGAAMGSDFAALGRVGLAAFSGGGMPPQMAYKMFDGSVSDFQKFKAKRALMGMAGQNRAGGRGGGQGGGGGLGMLAMGKLAAFTGGGMSPMVAYKMFDGSVSDFQRYKLKKKMMGNLGGQGGSAISSAMALGAVDGSMADMAKFTAMEKLMGGGGQGGGGQSGGGGGTGSTGAAAGTGGAGAQRNAGQGGMGMLGGLGKLQRMRINDKLCEDTPVIYRYKSCGPNQPCTNAMTKCTQTLRYGRSCCAKNFMAVRMFENMPGF